MDRERREFGGVSLQTGTEYGQLIDRLQEGERKLLKRLVWPVLMVLLLFNTGCIENTIRGAGKMIESTGELIGGVGKDVIRGTDGYSNER